MSITIVDYLYILCQQNQSIYLNDLIQQYIKCLDSNIFVFVIEKILSFFIPGHGLDLHMLYIIKLDFV